MHGRLMKTEHIDRNYVTGVSSLLVPTLDACPLHRYRNNIRGKEDIYAFLDHAHQSSERGTCHGTLWTTLRVPLLLNRVLSLV